VLAHQKPPISGDSNGLQLLSGHAGHLEGGSQGILCALQDLGGGIPSRAYDLVVLHHHCFGGGGAGVDSGCEAGLLLPGQEAPVLDCGD